LYYALDTRVQAGAAQRVLMHELARSDMPAELIVDRQRLKVMEHDEQERQRVSDVAKKEKLQGNTMECVRAQFRTYRIIPTYNAWPTRPRRQTRTLASCAVYVSHARRCAVDTRWRRVSDVRIRIFTPHA
jgi:hypothetical protein